MRKTHMKLGSLLLMTCLFVAAGMSMGVGNASAQQVQASKKFHHWSAQAPHITIKMLPSTAAHPANRVVISGVGFTNCCPSASNSYSACSNSCGTSANTSTNACDCGTGTSANTSTNACDNATCTSSTSQTSSTDTNTTTTTTTTTTTSPSTTTYTVSAPSSTAPSSAPGNTYPSSAPGNTYPSSAPGDTCPSACGNSSAAPSATYPSSAPSDTCSSYDPCGNSSTAPSANDTGSTNCACGNTVDLQSSLPLYAPGMNLTRIPVNAFGEFNVTVNLHPRRFGTRHHYTMPTIWAINSYNDQPSNYASVGCTCTSCCS